MSGPLAGSALLEAARGGDSAACEQVLLENNGLIWSVVRRYYGRGVEPDDLYQLGCLGFLKAVQGFDPQYGTQFSTYAVPKIAGEIRRFLRDDGPVKVSRGLKERGSAIRGTRARLAADLGREPTLSELAEETGLTPEEKGMVERLTLRTAIEALPERERQVLLLRYYKGLTQMNTARVLGVSQVQVSRLERRALDKLRRELL